MRIRHQVFNKFLIQIRQIIQGSHKHSHTMNEQAHSGSSPSEVKHANPTSKYAFFFVEEGSELLMNVMI